MGSEQATIRGFGCASKVPPDPDDQEPQEQHELRDAAEQERRRERRGNEWQPEDARRRAPDDERDADRSWDERRAHDEVAEEDEEEPEEGQCEHLRAATQAECEV
jgi:hypothetical protein